MKPSLKEVYAENLEKRISGMLQVEVQKAYDEAYRAAQSLHKTASYVIHREFPTVGHKRLIEELKKFGMDVTISSDRDNHYDPTVYMTGWA